MRDFAPQAAADATVVHVRHRVHLERVGGRLERERGTAGEPDAGMIPGAGIVIDAEASAHHARTQPEQAREYRADAPLALELALALGDDDFQSRLIGGE